ncbi:hypothetical protein B0H10DRAFT_1298299 [Mycena sp. CBHHK59/15]|nr:hypothetical protein B0H10DRAFT_1298299 [Mycena sp. CBHHK59/15]
MAIVLSLSFFLPPPPPLPSSLSHPAMQQQQQQQNPRPSPFLPLYDHSPPPRASGVAQSIWAPQPQASESTWPRALEAFSRSSAAAPTTREDVFGPVGAVGDGRGGGGNGKTYASANGSPDLRSDSCTHPFW